MPNPKYTSLAGGVLGTGIANDKNLGSGLNSTAGPLQLQNSESSDLQNIDFDKFGAILKRNGYSALNTSAIASGGAVDGLYWYEFNNAGTLTRYAICVAGGKIFQMAGNNLTGTWTDITGSVTITSGNHCDFETAFNVVYITNGVDKPFQWNGSGNASIVPTFGSGYWTFEASGITTTPAVGTTYTNNTVTFTVVASVLTNGSGYIIASGSGAPETSGILTKTGGGTGDATITYTAFGQDTNLTAAKYVKLYNNYLFFINVTVGTTYYPSRIYWTNIRNPNTMLPTSFIEVNMNDGQEMTGGKVLGDNLILFKNRAIFSLAFTGDSDIPFVLPGGGRTNSSVGCIAPFSIVLNDNGVVFMSYDGLYIFDGSNSFKLSDRITTTLFGYNTTRFPNIVASAYRLKNLLFFSFSGPASSTNNRVVVWNYFLNSWSVYVGMSISSLCTFFINGITEVPYFGDYSGFVYQMDAGSDDYPLNVQTAINAYYYTNWRDHDDLLSQKYTPEVVVYYELNDGTLTFAYSYDFEATDQYASIFNMNTSTSVYGTAVYGTAVYAGEGATYRRIDLTSRGRTVRYKFANSNMSEKFKVEGIGTMVNEETNV